MKKISAFFEIFNQTLLAIAAVSIPIGAGLLVYTAGQGHMASIIILIFIGLLTAIAAVMGMIYFVFRGVFYMNAMENQAVLNQQVSNLQQLSATNQQVTKALAANLQAATSAQRSPLQDREEMPFIIVQDAEEAFDAL